MEIVTGYVEHIVFRNEENGYTVFQLESEAGEVTCVGTLNFISEGERLEIKGDYVNHNIYGSQLKIQFLRDEGTGRSDLHRAVSWFRCDQRSRCSSGRKNCKEV